MGGKTVEGVQVWTAVLSVEDVREIRRSAKHVRQADLARRYNVSRQAIFQIINRQTWKHVT